MLLEFMLAAALDINTASNADLERYYWDCDTAFMKGEMGGQDLSSCLAITEAFQERVFNNDATAFKTYWSRNKEREWSQRGFVSRNHT